MEIVVDHFVHLFNTILSIFESYLIMVRDDNMVTG